MARAAARRLGKGGEDKEGFGHFGHSNSSLPTGDRSLLATGGRERDLFNNLA